MGRYQGYKKYKESGVEWLGEIPDHWEVGRFSHFIDFQEGPGIMAVDFLDYGVPLLRIHNLKSGFVDLEGCNYLDPQKVKKVWNHFKLKKNDLLISCSASTGLVSVVDDNSENSIAYTGIIRLNPANQRICREFIKVLVNSELFSNQIDLLKTGTTIQHYGPVHLRQIKITLPPLDEQESIAHFLDRKTSQIDALIAKKEALLEKLDEKRTALISHAVTKGLNPHVPMKDSGVEWLGDIPDHWEVKRLKYVGKFINGFSFSSNDFTDFGIRVLKISNIQHMKIDWSDSSFIDEDYYEIASAFRVYENDLVFALTRPIISTGIKAALIDSNEKILLNQRNCIFRAQKSMYNKWTYYMLLCSFFLTEFDLRIDRTGQQPNISSNDIADINIPVPTEQEQEIILDFLNKMMSKIDLQKAKVQEAIELLKEYRTALITNAVTGKIDVRQVSSV